MLPKNPVTIQISDSHVPGKMSHHMLLWHRLPQHHQYYWVLIWGSCVAALGMDGETMLLRESGQEWRETLGAEKNWCFLFLGVICKANIQSAFFYRPQQYILFLYSQSYCFWPNIRTLARSCGTDRVSLFLVAVLQTPGGVSLICSGSQVSLRVQWNSGLHLRNLLPASLVSI